MKEKKNGQEESIKISENTTIVYKNGGREIFDAVHITDTGVKTGHIINQDEFEEGGFIPKNNIKKILHGSKIKRYKKKQIGLISIFLGSNIAFFFMLKYQCLFM